eukprot:5621046-Amphidinium_carterae.1
MGNRIGLGKARRRREDHQASEGYVACQEHDRLDGTGVTSAIFYEYKVEDSAEVRLETSSQ